MQQGTSVGSYWCILAECGMMHLATVYLRVNVFPTVWKKWRLKWLFTVLLKWCYSESPICMSIRCSVYSAHEPNQKSKTYVKFNVKAISRCYIKLLKEKCFLNDQISVLHCIGPAWYRILSSISVILISWRLSMKKWFPSWSGWICSFRFQEKLHLNAIHLNFHNL